MKILAIDDDPLFRKNYELMLARSHELHLAGARAEAESKLDAEVFDVVLLDQNLEGPAGGATGLDLIANIRSASPGAKLIVVSGFWDQPNVIQQAFDRGVDDYLVKGQHLTPLLLAKLSEVESQLRTRRRAVASDRQLDRRVRDVFSELDGTVDSHRKGPLLEELVTGLLRLSGGFRDVRTNVRNDIEEIDIVAFADDSSLWAQRSPLWLVECKNWSSTVGRNELDVLVGKMGRRHGQCNLGLMVAWGGVSEPFARGAHVLPNWIVAVVTREQLRAAVESDDRARALTAWVDAAVLEP